jgi:glutathione synthase/RimK-type ligase-like ATP-grasp enzyme
MRLYKGKWKKYNVLMKDERLKPFIPETKRLNEVSFWEMMDRHQQVIVKPNRGRWGIGLMKIKRVGNDEYELHSELNKWIIQGRLDTYNIVKRYLRKKKNIVQQAIDVATINDCPFDLRVMVQKNEAHPSWVITGIVAKVASKGYFITNTAHKVMYMQDALEESTTSTIPVYEIMQKVEEVALMAANQLSTYYVNHHIFGLDIGIDHHGNPWIFEANYSPNLSVFRLLEDEHILSKINAFKAGQIIV